MARGTVPLRLSTFADRFPAEMRERVEHLATTLVSSTGDALEGYLDASTPTDTGKLKSSRTRTMVKKGLRLGWTDPSAVGVDAGRIMSKTYSRKTKHGKSRAFSRLLGSEQAPEGFTRPAIKALRLGWDQVVADAGKDF